MTGDAAYSHLDAYGGTIATPNLTTATGIYIDKDASGSVNTSQITNQNGSVIHQSGSPLGTNTWVAAGGGDWDTAANWSNGQVPAADDVVSIPQSGITVTKTGGSVTVANIISAAALSFSGVAATLITGASEVDGALTLAGSSLTVQGAGTTSLRPDRRRRWFKPLCHGGGRLSMPGVDELHQPATVNDQYRTLEASGPGSMLDLVQCRFNNQRAPSIIQTSRSSAGQRVNQSRQGDADNRPGDW